MMYTTLNQIRKHKPCSEGWAHLLNSLGGKRPDDKPLSLYDIMVYNGFDDALWALRSVDGHDKEIRLFAIKCANAVKHLVTDVCVLDMLYVAEQFAIGMATEVELRTTYHSASNAYILLQDVQDVSCQVAAQALLATGEDNAGIAAEIAAHASRLASSDKGAAAFTQNCDLLNLISGG